MKKILLFLILSFVFLKLHPQAIGVFGGYNMNTNTHPLNQVSDNEIHFPAKFGASVGFGIDFFKIADLPIRMTCSFDNFNGTIKEGTMGMMGGAGSELNANYNKQSLCFGIHLLNKKIKGNLRISLGCEYNVLILEKLDGSSYSWNMRDSMSVTKTINENGIKLSKNSLGLVGTIGIEENITKDLYIMPQLSLYFGVTDEFNNALINRFRNPLAFRILFQMSIFKRTKYLFEVPKLKPFKISKLNLFKVPKLNLFKCIRFNKLKDAPLYPD